MRALAAAVLLCAGACTPDFAAPSDIRDLRILAVQAEPPEAQFDDAGVDPVQVTILAMDPRTPAPLEVTARLCAPTDSRRCDEGPPVVEVPDAGLTTTLSLPPGFVLAAQQLDDLKGLGGIRVQYSFSVQNGDPGGPVYGSKVLLFSPRGAEPNHNPRVAGLDLTRDGVASGHAAAGDTLELSAGVEVGLRPLLADGSIEEYVVTDFRGNPVRVREQPRYSFFVTAGAEIGVDSADEPLDGGAPPDGLSRITYRAGEGSLWVVVRDGRGGESWARFGWKQAPPAVTQTSSPAPARSLPGRR